MEVEIKNPYEEEDTSLRELLLLLGELSRKVYEELGSGFPEEIYQKALMVEMREAGIRFQREVNIEIYYKGIPLGFDRPDFVIRPFSNGRISVSKPVVVELKTVSKLKEDHITQGKTYLRSLPHSSDGELKECDHCILINFPKNDGKSVELILLERRCQK